MCYQTPGKNAQWNCGPYLETINYHYESPHAQQTLTIFINMCPWKWIITYTWRKQNCVMCISTGGPHGCIFNVMKCVLCLWKYHIYCLWKRSTKNTCYLTDIIKSHWIWVCSLLILTLTHTIGWLTFWTNGIEIWKSIWYGKELFYYSIKGIIAEFLYFLKASSWFMP